MTHPRHQHRANHEKARKEGKMFYDGALCIRHNCRMRYVSNYSCVECRKAHNRRIAQYKIGQPRSGYNKENPMRPLKPWPEMHLEDTAPGYNDAVGTYRAQYAIPSQASSAADAAEE